MIGHKGVIILKDIRILGMDIKLFILVAIVTVLATMLDWLPTGMIGAFLFMMVIGEILDIIGNNLPIVKTYFGGGPIVAIFASSALVYFQILPEAQVESFSTFMTSGGFLDFYIAALITGSILGMDRNLLIKAAIRYFPCILGGVALALGLVALVAPLFSMSPAEAIAYIGIPIMGGGMGAGAVPIAEVFAGALNIEATTILSRLVPAVALGNALAIVAGGLLDRLGKKYPSLTGNGKLMVGEDDSSLTEDEVDVRLAPSDYAAGIVLALCFFTFGALMSRLVENLIGLSLHTYAWMIITVAIFKAADILPETITGKCAQWYSFVSQNFTTALLVGIGIAYTDLGQVIASFSLSYLVLVATVLLGAVVGSGLVGRLVGFYPIEAALTAGLCMANMGGTGDVAVLSAANRMKLMPFAQISSRLGGALIIFVASVLVPIIF